MLLDSSWVRELAHASRRLRKTPGFAAIVIATLAIGIGVNTAMFGLIDSLLFRPPANVTDPDRVVRVQFTIGESAAEARTWGRVNYPVLEDLDATRAFESVAGFTDADVSIGRGADAVEAQAMIVTPSFFRTLGVRSHIGTMLGQTSAVADNEIVLSYGFWARRFGSDPRIVGKPIIVGTHSYVIAGVAPNGFTALQYSPVDVWFLMNDLAAPYLSREWRTERRAYYLDVVARVASLTSAAAAARASTLFRSSARDDGTPSGIVTSSLIPSRNLEKSREVRVSLWLASVTAFVLLIACANIANLIMARNVAREREYGVRLSLGASHWQLRRQLIADIIAIAVPGLVLAMFVEYTIRRAIPAFISAEVPIANSLLDSRAALLMAVSASIAIGFVAIVSLVQVRPGSIALSLKAHVADDRRGGVWVRGTLLAIQSGLCVALLFSAGLFAKSLTRALGLDLGVDLNRTVQLTFNVPRGSLTPEAQRALYERTLERVRTLPGIEIAALSASRPYQSGTGSSPFTAEQTMQQLWEGKGEVAYAAAVGSGFFTTAGAATLSGRDFNDDDRAGAPRVAIINANLAARLWPGGGGLGTCLFLDEARECYRVVGVLGGAWKLRALDRTKMTVYTALAQTPDAQPGALFVRTRGPAGRILASLRLAAQSVDPSAPAVSVSRARDLVDGEFRPWRLGATLFTAFSAVALLIAAVGMFGVVSFTTSLRIREIGVRMALGARARHIVRVVAGSGLAAVMAGLVAGSAASLIAARKLGDVLYQTSPSDPIVLAQTAGVLLVVAAVAVVVPVIRALRLDPAAVLRSD